ncbi:MAG: ferrous iron transport protein A [Candidatus Omnitrophica bacterium]|nr:ferrous iron transport protein A [Candidatus Omnitrophota bacterium]
MKCSLCGWEFGEQEAGQACGKCWMQKGCELVRCPQCGFEMVLERAVRGEAAGEAVSLDRLKMNEKAEVSHVHTQDRRSLQKLIAMGVLPRTPITVVRKFPSYVFRIDHALFSVDKELASSIYVKRAFLYHPPFVKLPLTE